MGVSVGVGVDGAKFASALQGKSGTQELKTMRTVWLRLAGHPPAPTLHWRMSSVASQPAARFSSRRARTALRVALSYYVTNGLSTALGLLLISGTVHLLLGPFAAAAASVGVIVVTPPDQPAPRRGKFWQLLPAALIGSPLFFAVQVLHAEPLRLGVLLVLASFGAFLGGAWGKRGLPISVSVMLALIFSMAVPAQSGGATVLSTSLYFALGAAMYLVYAPIMNAVLNARYRVQMLADTLLAVAALMRTQARQFTPGTAEAGPAPPVGLLMRQQAELADQLQVARDILLEAARTPQRQRLAGMLVLVLEMRDHLLASGLDLDTLQAQPGQAPLLAALRMELEGLADEIERLCDALLLGREPTPPLLQRPALALLPGVDEADLSGSGGSAGTPSPAVLARAMTHRMGHLHDEMVRLVALARGEAAPDLAVVRTNWQMFVSPTTWVWPAFAALWRRDAPTLRHAIRAALAIGTGYAVAVALPWGTHDYWILLTITVVLRGSLAQTVERRNARVAGTLVGGLLAWVLLSVNAPPLLMLLVVTLAQGVAHAFAIRRYLITAVAVTVLALVQAHQLSTGTNPTVDLLERLADTFIGTALAWGFSYVLPSWERTQIPALVSRMLAAQARHARVALGLGQLHAVDNEPELMWRLARREAFDSLSVLVQATQRSLVEPRAVRPPLEPLGRLLAYSYQLLGQLTAVKTMLLRQRGRLQAGQIQAPMQQAAEALEALLLGTAAAAPRNLPAEEPPLQATGLTDPFVDDLSPWLLRRLQLAEDIAAQLHAEAERVLAG